VAEAMIVVGSMKLGESDRIIRLLSPTKGRLSVVARRARSSSKGSGALLDLGTQVSVSLRWGRGAMPSLSNVELLQAPNRARTDIDRIALLAYGCEVCSGLSPEGQGAPKLIQLLAIWLDLLELPIDVATASRIAMEAKALTFAGLTPSLARCSRCGLAIDGSAVFSAQAGGACHSGCGAGQDVAPLALAEFESLRRAPLIDTVSVRLSDASWPHRWLLADFAQWHTGRSLRSRALLQDLEPPRAV